MTRRTTTGRDNEGELQGDINQLYPPQYVSQSQDMFRYSQNLNDYTRISYQESFERIEEMRRRDHQERLQRNSRVYSDYDPFSNRLSARMDFSMDALMSMSHEKIVGLTVEKISEQVVKAAAEKIASKLVDRLVAKFEGEILASVKELANELSRNMEDSGAENGSVPQWVEGSENFPRIT